MSITMKEFDVCMETCKEKIQEAIKSFERETGKEVDAIYMNPFAGKKISLSVYSIN